MNTPTNSEALPPTTGSRGHSHCEAFAMMKYASTDGRTIEMIWNSQDGVTPFCVMAKDGKTELRHVDWQRDEYRPNHQLQPGDRYFGPITRSKAEEYAAQRIKSMDGTEYELQGEERVAMQARVAESILEDFTPDLLVFSENDQEQQPRAGK